MVMLPSAYYQNLYERVSNLSLDWAAYSVDPSVSAGGAMSLKGTFELSDAAGFRVTAVVDDIETGAADSVPVNYVPPNFITSGIWDRPDKFPTTGTVRALLNLATGTDIHEAEKTLDLLLNTWDGSAAVYRVPNVVGGAFLTPGSVNELLRQIFSVTAAQVADSMGGKFTGPYQMQQGAMSDMLRNIAGIGVYLNMKMLGTVATPVVIRASATPQSIRLINMSTPIRTRSRPSYIAQVTVNSYRTRHVVNGVVYKADTAYTVASNTITQVRVPTKGTPANGSLIQPLPVTTITPVPYTGPISPYVVYDSAGYEASARWLAGSGKVTAQIGNTPNELLLTFIGPIEINAQTYTLNDGSGSTRPALYVSATDAVTTAMMPITVPTAATVPTNTFRPPDQPLVVDNPLVMSDQMARDRIQIIIANSCLPRYNLKSFNFESAVLFNHGYDDAVIPVDEIIGSVFQHAGCKWRIVTCTYDQAADSYTATAEAHTLCADVAADVAGLTCASYIALLTANFGGTFPTMQQYIDAPLTEIVT